MTRYYVRKSIRRWAFLEPWCAFLREHARLQLLTDHKSDLLLCVRLRPEPRESADAYTARVVQLREALELLTMIAFVDTLAWQDLLRYKCNCVSSPFWDDWSLPLGMWLKLGDSKNPELAAFDTAFYRAFFTAFNGSDGDRVVSDTMKLAMQGILCEMTPAMHRELSRHGRVEVCLRLIPSRSLKPQDVTAYLQDAVDAVNECLAITAETGDLAAQYASKLVLNDVELHIGRIEFSPGATRILADFMELGTQTTGLYPLLDFGLDSVLGRLPLTELEPLLRAIARRVSSANKRPRKSGDADALSPIESFALMGNRTFVRSVEATHSYARRAKALFSTLSKSQCFDDIHLDYAIGGIADSTRAKKWQWLAYALFSKDSTARVSKLTISEPSFTQSDMNAILSVLNTRNPASKLSGLGRTTRDCELLENRLDAPRPGEDGDLDSDLDFEDDDAAGINDEDPDVRAYFCEESGDNAAKVEAPCSVLVRKGTSIQIDPFNVECDANPPESFVLSDDVVYRVIQDDPERDWVEVLVPCFGLCAAPRASVVRSESGSHASDAATSLSWGYRGSIEALRLDLEAEASVTLFLPLLKYLGSSLLCLETAQGVVVERQSLHQVFEACPRLKSLRVCEPRSETERELIDGYAQGRCSITELRFDDFAPLEAVMDFIRVLQDPTTRAARTLEKLSLFIDSDFASNGSLLVPILEMLASNTVLELLQLEIYAEQMKEFKPRFMEYHGQVISGVRSPFSIERRVAFLSVVRFVGVEGADGARPHKRMRLNRPIATTAGRGGLDRGVISLIFQFAAERKRRRIRLHEVDLS